jgi:hypothetical protein
MGKGFEKRENIIVSRFLFIYLLFLMTNTKRNGERELQDKQKERI